MKTLTLNTKTKNPTAKANSFVITNEMAEETRSKFRDYSQRFRSDWLDDWRDSLQDFADRHFPKPAPVKKRRKFKASEDLISAVAGCYFKYVMDKVLRKRAKQAINLVLRDVAEWEKES